MKKTVQQSNSLRAPLRGIIIILLTAVIIGGCNNSSSFTASPADTTVTLAAFIEIDSSRKLDKVFRINVDTFKIFREDGKKEAKLVRQSIYYLPQVLAKLDSSGKPLKDSLGNMMFYVNYRLAPEGSLLKDFDVNIDSLMNPKGYKK